MAAPLCCGDRSITNYELPITNSATIGTDHAHYCSRRDGARSLPFGAEAGFTDNLKSKTLQYVYNMDIRTATLYIYLSHTGRYGT